MIELPSGLTRLNLSYMTELTQIQMFGGVIHKRYDHSIHPTGRASARKNTKRTKLKLKSGKEIEITAGTEPSRTRPGKAYPGGRTLRRAFRRLHEKREGIQHGPHKRPDRIRSTKDILWGEPGYTKPGSMK